MYLLAIETTGAYASVALLEAGQDAPRILEVIHGSDRFSHLQNLTPQIQQVLTDNELSIDDMTAIAVSHGPGSFTGIRIGVSTARALSQVSGVPGVPVSSLEALALRALEMDAALSDRTLICPILDARRKQVYGAAYVLVDGKPAEKIAAASCLLTEFLEKVDAHLLGESYDSILFLGDGIDTCGDIIEDWMPGHPAVRFAPQEARYQDAAAVALRGWQLYQEGLRCSYMQLQPKYLRMAEAEKKLQDRQQAGRAGQAAETPQSIGASSRMIREG